MKLAFLLFAGLAMGLVAATSGCRSCSTNYDYAAPVANSYCDACGTHRCGSNSGGVVSGDCASGGCSTCGPMMDAPMMGEPLDSGMVIEGEAPPAN